MGEDWPSDSSENEFAVSHKDFSLTNTAPGSAGAAHEVMQQFSSDGKEYFNTRIGFELGTYFDGEKKVYFAKK